MEQGISLTHLDGNDNPKMVDVSKKDVTNREALASGKIEMSKEAFDMIRENRAKKGPVLQTAIIASIMGAKKTSEIIPMCHPLNISGIECDIDELEETCGFRLYVRVKVSGNTGVEMEALSGVSIGLLTIYDMIKAIDKEMVIGDIALLRKSGGRSGEFVSLRK